MAESYGGLVWSDQPAPQQGSSFGVLALAGAGAAGAGYWATREGPGGRRPIDTIAAAARYGGNLSPGQLLNTFRVPEILSPFTSAAYRSMNFPTDPDLVKEHWEKFGWAWEDGGHTFRLDASYLGEDSTYDWLKYTTGLDEAGLRQAGITRGMLGGGEEAAKALVWRRGQGATANGTLSAVTPTGEKELAKHVALQASNMETHGILSGRHGLNRIATGQFAAAGMYDRPGVDPEFFDSTILSRTNAAGEKQTASWMFTPGLARENGLGRGTNLLRGIAAYEMDRFNQILHDLSERLGGETGRRFFTNFIGFQPGVRPGPASTMLFRFAGRAAMAGGAALAVGELDWARRRFGPVGQATASTVMSAGIGWAAYRMGAAPKLAKTAAIASFFGQMMLPGFDQGFGQGIASTFATLDVIRSAPINPFNYLRRTLEGLAPGSTNWETGALIGIGAAAAAGLRLPYIGRLPEVIAANYNVGIPASRVAMAIQSTRDNFYEALSRHPGLVPHQLDPTSFRDRRRMRGLLTEHFGGDRLRALAHMNAEWSMAEERVKTLKRDNKMNDLLVDRLRNVHASYSGSGIVDTLQRNVRGHALNAFYSFFGADLSTAEKSVKDAVADMGFRGMGKVGRVATVGLFALAAHQFFTGGAIGSMESMGEKADIYAGRKMVEVKKGRWWEGGGTPYEGAGTSYFRPSLLAGWMHRSREAAIWGEDHDKYSPIQKFFLKNFTYHLERQNYYDRPYPISAGAFADVPIVGGMLSNTIGRLIKPAKIMHAGEWMREGPEGQIQFASVYKGSRQEPAYELGALPPGIPTNALAPSSVLANLGMHFRELEGIPGWAKNTVQKTLTGKDNFGSDGPFLATSNEMTSWRHAFWDADLGGMLFTNEFVRRFLPRILYNQRGQNPITNTMPAWLPDKFHYGDPYTSIHQGHMRLPGAGYAALHPELRGVDPSDYPMIAKYSILADVAPASREFAMLKELVYRQRMEGGFTPEQENWIDTVDRQHAEVMNQYNFDYLHPNAVQLPGSSLTRGLWGAITQTVRKVAAPVEYMVPMGMRPVQKLLSNRDPVEQYEYERMYGTPMSFWDEPVRDWFRPALYSAMNLMGYQGKPLWRHEADAVGSYFDKLEYIKQMRAADEARAMGDNNAAHRAEWAAGQTRMGVNPMGSPLAIYWSIPSEERKFFNAFAHAQGADRDRILRMIPQDQTHLYQAIWDRMDSGDPSLWAGAPNVVDPAYLDGQRIDAEMAMLGKLTPGDDWIGWNQAVDMDDIKVRYVENLGRDIHDFGLWESQLKKSMSQPFLDGADREVAHTPFLAAFRGGINAILGDHNSSITQSPFYSSNASITVHDNRHEELAAIVTGAQNGY